MMIKSWVPLIFSFDAYQANTLAESVGERVQDVHSWAKPLCQPFIAPATLIELADDSLKCGQNLDRRLAGFELGDKGMCEKVMLCVVFVTFQGTIEN